MCPGNDKCDAATWLLPVAFLIGLFYVVLLVWFPFNHHPLWKFGIYFLQIVPLLASVEDSQVMQTVLAVFSLNLAGLGVRLSVCPWPNLDAVQKMATAYVLPVLLLAALTLVLLLHFLYRSCWASLNDNKEATADSLVSEEGSLLLEEDEILRVENDQEKKEEESGEHLHHSEYARYASALTGLLLLMYEGVTTATMALLNCVPVDGKLRIFEAGEVPCFTSWQYGLFALLLGVLSPFPLILVLLHFLFLRKGNYARNVYVRAVRVLVRGTRGKQSSTRV